MTVSYIFFKVKMKSLNERQNTILSNTTQVETIVAGL